MTPEHITELTTRTHLENMMPFTRTPDFNAVDAVLAAGVGHDTPGWIEQLHALLPECDRDIAQETADELGIPLPDCAREGWAA